MKPFAALRMGAAALTAVAVAVALGGCAASNDAADASAPEITFMLDWTPNTNHTGVFVAQKLGYYKAAGIRVKILPYSQNGVEASLGNGVADFGTSTALLTTKARAAGIGVVSVLNVQQQPTQGFGVLKSNTSVKSPRDLDGKTVASYGASEADFILKHMIQVDGGTGTFNSVTMNTSTFEAVFSGKAATAEGFSTWEGVEAQLRGKPLKFFRPDQYGVPANPADSSIAASSAYVKKHPKLARAFVRATQKGYQYAIDHPQKAADILVEQNPQAKLSTKLVRRSQKLLSTQYWIRAGAKTGAADPQRWKDYVDYLVSQGLLTNRSGKPISTAPAAADLYTNQYLR